MVRVSDRACLPGRSRVYRRLLNEKQRFDVLTGNVFEKNNDVRLRLQNGVKAPRARTLPAYLEVDQDSKARILMACTTPGCIKENLSIITPA